MINDGVLEHLLLQVNLPYILWVVAFNAWFLLSYFILDTVFYPTPEHSKTRKLSSTRDTEAKEPLSNFQRNSHDRQAKATPAPLLDAINKNGLALFLLVSADSFSFPVLFTGIKQGKRMYGSDQSIYSHNRRIQYVRSGNSWYLYIYPLRSSLGHKGMAHSKALDNQYTINDRIQSQR